MVRVDASGTLADVLLCEGGSVNRSLLDVSGLTCIAAAVKNVLMEDGNADSGFRSAQTADSNEKWLHGIGPVARIII